MTFIKILFLLSLFSFSVLAHTSLQSDDSQAKKDKVILTVAIEEIGYFPFNYEENGEIKGFSVDILDYVEANSKYDFEFITLPWPRALYLVERGKVDLLLTLFKTSKREKTYHFIEPSYGNEVNQLFALSDNKFEFNGQLKQLTPYSIGTTREYSYGEDFDHAHYLTKLPALTEEVLLKLLLGKRIDMAISNPLIFNQMITKNNLNSQVKAIAPYIAITPVHMALTKERKGSAEIKQTIGQLTKQLKASAYYQKLLDKYQLNY
jgi:polar amino acid transport system substrate-binding protein